MTILLLIWAMAASIGCAWILGNLHRETFWRDKRIQRLERQRDCLHEHFTVYSEKFFMYEIFPDDLWEVLEELRTE